MKAVPLCASCEKPIPLRRTYCDQCRDERRRESWRIAKWNRAKKPWKAGDSPCR